MNTIKYFIKYGNEKFKQVFLIYSLTIKKTMKPKVVKLWVRNFGQKERL